MPTSAIRARLDRERFNQNFFLNRAAARAASPTPIKTAVPGSGMGFMPGPPSAGSPTKRQVDKWAIAFSQQV